MLHPRFLQLHTPPFVVSAPKSEHLSWNQSSPLFSSLPSCPPLSGEHIARLHYCYYLAAVGRVIHKLGGAGDRFGDYLCADCPFLPCVSRRSQLINTKFTKHITNISKSSCRQTVLGHCCYTVPPCVCLQGDYVWWWVLKAVMLSPCTKLCPFIPWNVHDARPFPMMMSLAESLDFCMLNICTTKLVHHKYLWCLSE